MRGPRLTSSPMVHRPPCVLSIAGSDSGGGAGIQADLKAFARAGVHGMTAITAITAQNTTEVRAVHQIPPETIVAQVAAVQDDIGIDAVKIGMLGDTATIEAVEAALRLVPSHVPMVLDPVMVAESGAVLLDEGARDALVERIVSRAKVVTPNIPEARVLAGRDGSPEELAELVWLLTERPAVVLTGGHSDSGDDIFFDGEEPVTIPGERHPDGAAHGSGCTHSATLAAHLALGAEPYEAACRAREAASEAVRKGLAGVGHGAGPVDVLGSEHGGHGAVGAGDAQGRDIPF
jgi:hydroxymethylpyrimidine/phosphomethylpyrimidine kinase